MADDDTLLAIREAVRAVCSRFDDDYWSACDQEHRFPREFYDAMAAGGWIGIAIPERYGVAAHLGDRPGVDAVGMAVDEEQRHAVGRLGALLERRRPGEQ